MGVVGLEPLLSTSNCCCRISLHSWWLSNSSFSWCWVLSASTLTVFSPFFVQTTYSVLFFEPDASLLLSRFYFKLGFFYLKLFFLKLASIDREDRLELDDLEDLTERTDWPSTGVATVIHLSKSTNHRRWFSVIVLNKTCSLSNSSGQRTLWPAAVDGKDEN
jgi:hypothetical protein